MPTFSFSDNELRKLVRFFQSLSQQPMRTSGAGAGVTAKETTWHAACSQAPPALSEVPRHRRPESRQDCHRAKLPPGQERLKPDWVERWITDPQAISPGTSMPSGLFKQQNNQWVFAGPTPPTFQATTEIIESC